MSAIRVIFWRDFRAYFSTPKAAIINFVILIIMSLFFISFVSTYLDAQRSAAEYGGVSYTLPQLLRAFYFNLHFILILIVPGVTMSVFSADRLSHSYKLLQNAPVFAYQIVIGKYLAAVALLSLILLSTFVYPAYLVMYGNPDIGPIITAYLGIFLLIASQVAFGVWIASMTESQFMAFGLTITGTFILMILNWVAPNISGGGIGEGILKYMASTPHLDNFIKGLITVADTTYFLIGVFIFLLFATSVVDSERWR
ncbi:ABC transporter permease [Oligoflexaceae bacterium]|nr:ABC transporter permease [Oligoflexaceae bacterium]